MAAGILAHQGAVAGRDALRTQRPAPRQAQRHRRLMLTRVRTWWIQGVLDQALETIAWIELGLQRRPDAVRPRAGLVTYHPDGQERTLPPGRSISAAFDELGQALLILDAPGSGKTMLLLDLARELLGRAERDAAHLIPVIFNLTSWAVRRPPLADWLVDELVEGYDVSRGVGQDWVDSEQILPLLDGLDEVAPAHRDGCVEAINAFRQDHGFVPLVVCSRTAEHAELRTQLRLMGAVEIQPLTRSQVHAHLKQAGEPLAGVRAALRDDPTLWELLESPLLLSIMVLTYQGKPAAALPATGTLQDRRQRLFAAYTDAMFVRRTEHPRYPKQSALRWLAWLARSLQRHQQTEFYLERIQGDWLPTSAQQRMFTVGSVLFVGLFIGLLAVLIHGPTGLLLGLVAGLFYGLGERHHYRRNGRVDRRCATLGATLVFGLVVGLAYEPLGGTRDLANEQAFTGLVYWPFGGLLVGLANGFFTRQAHRRRAAPPHERTGSSSALIPLMVGLVVGLFSGLLLWLVAGLHFGLLEGLRHGLSFGPIAAFYAGMCHGLGERSCTIQPAARLRWLWSTVRLHATLVVGLLTGLFSWLAAGLRVAVPAGLLAGLLTALSTGLSTRQLDESRTDPNERISRSVRNALLVGSSVGLFVGPFNALMYDDGVLTGFFGGVLAWLFFGGMAHIKHLLLRSIVVRGGFAPWRYIHFLEYATERLFLRRIGGGYIFVHRLLLEHFASLPVDDEPAGAKARLVSSRAVHSL